MKSAKIKLKNLSYLDKVKLETLSNEHRYLYNHLLSQSKDNCDFKKLNNSYVNFRNNNNLTINSKSAQNTCRGLINNIKSFFVLKKKDKSHQFPYKFKSYKYFQSFTYDWNNGNGGFKIKDNIVYLQKDLLKIKFNNFNNEINNESIKTLTIKKENNDYYLIFVYSEPKINTILNKNNFIAIDIGVKDLITATSNTINNFKIETEKFENKEKQTEQLQSKRDLRNKKSIKWNKFNKKFKKEKQKLTNKRKDWLHKITTKTVKLAKINNIGTIICGDINVKSLKKDHKTKLNKSTQNLYLSRFKTFMDHKSKKENIDFKLVNEAYTSQINHLTNKIEFNSDLSIREVEIKPNFKIDRDLNSAINIANKIMGKWLSQILNFNYDLDKMLLKEQSYLLNTMTGEVI